MIQNFDKNYVVYDYASIPKRFTARILDLLLIGIVMSKITNFQIGVSLAILFSIFQYIYSTLLIYFFGQTVGMFIVRTKVVSTKGKRLMLGQAIVRALCSKVSDFLIGAGDIWILFNDSNQTWHDILASTIVINKRSCKEVQEHFEGYPWPDIKRINILRFLALIASVLLVIYSSLNKLVNDFGKLGLTAVSVYETSGSIISAKVCSYQSKEGLYTLSMSGKTKTVDVYSPSKEGIKLSKSMKLEDAYSSDEVLSLSFSVIDMDSDNKNEIALSQIIKNGEKIISELAIYKDDGSKLNLINKIVKSDKDVGYYQSNLVAFEGKDKHKYVIWANNQTLETYTLEGSKLILTNKGYLPSTNSTIIYADFKGNGEKKLYAIQQGSKDLLEVSELEYTKNFEIHPYISVEDNIDYIEKLYNGQITSGDIDNDGKDELMIIDKENGVVGRKLLEKKEPAWLNVYSLNDNEWEKVWIGGNINENLMDKYSGNIKINEYGADEIIMIHDSSIKVYKRNPILFKLNSLWQKITKFRNSINIGIV